MSDVTYTAPCPGCGRDSAWSTSIGLGPAVTGVVTTSLVYEVECEQCDEVAA